MQVSDAAAAHRTTLDFIISELGRRSDLFLDRAENSLRSSWQDIKDPPERQLAKAAAEWLWSNKRSVQEALIERWSRALQTRESGAEPSELRILSDEEMSVILVRDRMVGQIMEHAYAELAALEARFHALEIAGSFANPKAIWPAALSDTFTAVLSHFGVPPKARTLLMSVYGEEGMKALVQFYASINAMLARLGVLPDFALPSKKAITNLKTTNTPRSEQWSHFALARGLEQVMSRLQHEAQAVRPEEWRSGIMRALVRQQLGDDSDPALAARVQSVDQVEGIFLEWLRDERLSDRVKAEMQRLALPLLVARLSRPGEFASSDSPVRSFMRQLAVIGYRDREVAISNFETLRLVVHSIVSEQGMDIESFRKGADALYTLGRNEIAKQLAARSVVSAPVEPVIKPVQEAVALPMDPDALATDAHRVVMVELTEHVAGLELPQEIQQFILRLLGPWMMVRYQRYGSESPPWRQARAFANAFFDGLRPAVNPADALRKKELRSRIIMQAMTRTQRSKMPAKEAAQLLGALTRSLTRLDNPAGASPESAGGSNGASFLNAMVPVVANVKSSS